MLFMGPLPEILPSFEILDALKKAALFGGRLIQPTISTNTTFRIQKLDIRPDGVMTISLADEVNVEGKWPVSVELNYRDISFQMDPQHYEISGRVITARLPDKAKALPARDHERYVLPFTSKVPVNLYRIEKRAGNLELVANILDVSRKGLGILATSPDDDEILKAHDHLWIKNLYGVELSSPLFATVVYVYQRKFKDSIDLKAGLFLEDPLPEHLYAELQDLSRLVLKG